MTDMAEKLHPNNHIQTFTGKRFYPLEPDAESICIKDIAHALSMICRYGGHCDRFYSVAEHSVLVGRKAGLHGLLHDGAEAYLLDIPSPVKALIPEYRWAEDRVQAAIYEALNIPPPTSEETQDVHQADRRMLFTEMAAIHRSVTPWYESVWPYTDVVIECWAPKEAEERFLDAYERLKQ